MEEEPCFSVLSIPSPFLADITRLRSGLEGGGDKGPANFQAKRKTMCLWRERHQLINALPPIFFLDGEGGVVCSAGLRLSTSSFSTLLLINSNRRERREEGRGKNGRRPPPPSLLSTLHPLLLLLCRPPLLSRDPSTSSPHPFFASFHSQQPDEEEQEVGGGEGRHRKKRRADPPSHLPLPFSISPN